MLRDPEKIPAIDLRAMFHYRRGRHGTFSRTRISTRIGAMRSTKDANGILSKVTLSSRALIALRVRRPAHNFCVGVA